MLRDATALADILAFGNHARSYVAGLDMPAFLSDPMRQHAVEHAMSLVGEAVKRLSDELRARYQDVAWAEVAGFRDVLLHQYHRVSLQEVWRVVQNDLPPFLDRVAVIRDELAQEESLDDH